MMGEKTKYIIIIHKRSQLQLGEVYQQSIETSLLAPSTNLYSRKFHIGVSEENR